MKKRILFHEQLLHGRRQKGLSQLMLAEMIGVDPRTLGRWERQEAFPSLYYHAKIAEVLGKTIEELGLYQAEGMTLPLEPEDVKPLRVALPEQAPPSEQEIPGLWKHHSHETVNVLSASIAEHIKAILRENAFVDHIALFGIDDILEKLREHLVAENSGWIMSLFGGGGLGKTALAYEVVARYAVPAGFTRLAWVSAKTVQILPDGTLLRSSSAELRWADIVKKMADQLGLTLGDSSTDWITDFQQGIRSLPPYEKCLLVIDNLETVEDVTEALLYLCNTSGGQQIIKPHKILITTRYSVLGKVQYIVERQLTGLNSSAALQFIRELGNEDIQQANDEDLMPIVEATERNPLLIKLYITRFLTSYLPLAFVLAELQEVHKFIGKNIVDYLYFESLSLMQEKCGEENSNRLLNAFCPLSAGESIDYATLLCYSGIVDESHFQRALRTACDLSLIRASRLNERSYSIHSLLWKFVCDLDS